MLLLAVLATVALAVATTSPLGSIKSDNGTLFISSSSTGAVIINEIDYVATITALQAAVAALQSLTTQQGATIQSQGADIATLTNNVAALQTLTNTQGSNIADLQGIASSHGSSISALTSTVASHTTAITGLATADGTQNSSIASLQSSAGVAASNITTLFSKVATLNATEITQGTSITTLQSNIATLQATVNNQGSNITTLFSTASTLNSGLTTANANLVSLNNSVQSTINTNIATLNTNVNSVNSSLNAFVSAPIVPVLGSATCSASNYGGMRINGSTVMVCVSGSAWIPLNPNIGSSASYPAASCLQILSIQGSNVNGIYWITQTGGTIIQQACSGSTNLGGNGTSALTSSASCSALQTYFAAASGMYYVGGVST